MGFRLGQSVYSVRQTGARACAGANRLGKGLSGVRLLAAGCAHRLPGPSLPLPGSSLRPGTRRNSLPRSWRGVLSLSQWLLLPRSAFASSRHTVLSLRQSEEVSRHALPSSRQSEEVSWHAPPSSQHALPRLRHALPSFRHALPASGLSRLSLGWRIPYQSTNSREVKPRCPISRQTSSREHSKSSSLTPPSTPRAQRRLVV